MNRRQAGSLALGVLGVAVAIAVVALDRERGAKPPTGGAAPEAASPAAPAIKAPPAPETAGTKPAGGGGQDMADAGASAPSKPAAKTPAATAPSAAAPAASGAAAGPSAAAPGADASGTRAEGAAAPDAAGSLPSFDVVRVEPDGSTVIAGRAAPGAHVDVMNGAQRIMGTDADENGDFVAVIDPPLAPGDYQLTLKAVGKTGAPTQSAEAATVSVPKDKAGEVLAMVTRPGAASRILTAPAPDTASAGAGDAAQSGAAKETAANPPAAAQSSAPVAGEAANHVRVDAVEIEGDHLYVAGSATPGDTVRIYADDVFVGEDPSALKGRFVVESTTRLAPGPHGIRADLVDPKSGKVIVRATVPFTRPEGDQFAAVAPPAATVPPGAAPPGDAAGSPAATATSTEPAPAAAAPGQTSGAAAGPKTVVQPALTNSDAFVIIRRGDTLWQIARRTYGRGIRYTTIYLANESQISNPDLILPGQVFDVPAKSSPDDEKLHRTLRENHGKPG